MKYIKMKVEIYEQLKALIENNFKYATIHQIIKTLENEVVYLPEKGDEKIEKKK